jgi:hypothetical protein
VHELTTTEEVLQAIEMPEQLLVAQRPQIDAFE